MKALRQCNNALYDTRLRMGLNQSELADLLELSRTTIGSWERGDGPLWIGLLCTGLKASLVLTQIAEQLTNSDLVQARIALRFSQNDLAGRLGVSRATLSRWENGTPPRWLSFVIATLAFKD